LALAGSLQALRQRPLTSPKQLKELSGLSFPTASKAIDALVDLGIAREITGGSARPGLPLGQAGCRDPPPACTASPRLPGWPGPPGARAEPTEKLKDADRRHHKVAFIGHQGNEMLGLRTIGEDFNPSRGIHHHPLDRYRRSPSR
jgi:hypothetical protein